MTYYGHARDAFLLPDLETLDPAALKAMICSQHREVISHRSQMEPLELLIAKLRRMQFGRSSKKVERQIEQLELKLEELDATKPWLNQTRNRSLQPRIVSQLPGRDVLHPNAVGAKS